MPVILDPNDHAAWLGEQPANDELLVLLKPHPADRMACFKIGPCNGIVKNDEPSLVEPII